MKLNKPEIPEGADEEEAAQIEKEFQNDQSFKRKVKIKSNPHQVHA